MHTKRPILILLALLTASSSLLPCCKSLDLGKKSAVLGAAAGGSIGALIGKKAGNSAIGATIGAALGGSTGAFIATSFTKVPDSLRSVRPIYVLNGTPYKEKAAQLKLQNISVQNIESVKVLNTTEATAIFGNKGEFGAIVINYK